MKRLFWIWYSSENIPRGLAVVEGESAGEAINTLKDVIVNRCQEIPPGSDLTFYCKMADPTQHSFTGADLNSCTFCHHPLSAHTPEVKK